ncbi:MAG TPA: carboxypeptidase-like regulatory domain-containing protein [Pyrinomonadaceae bacterium]|nr:carboxypeptidase-like regulatory domain-containing protein [Pyrinomonadaceae bacterium]
MKYLLGALLLAGGLTLQSNAQGVCVPPDLTVSAIRGRVVSVDGNHPIPEVKVNVINEEEEEEDKWIVASTVTDDDGNFAFPGIKSGSFYVQAKAFGFVPSGPRVRLTARSRANRKRAQIIIIAVGLDPSIACGGGYAELRPVKVSNKR